MHHAEHSEYCASCIPCDWLYIYIYIICIYPLENPLQKLNEENRNMAKTSVL